jgi:hypothetical protein
LPSYHRSLLNVIDEKRTKIMAIKKSLLLVKKIKPYDRFLEKEFKN